MRAIRAVVVVLVLFVAAAAAWVFSGVYDIGADAPHSAPVYRLLQTVLQRSIAVHARDVAVPPLDDAHMIGEGAEHYAAMCAGCHLAPGASDTEIRRGLYPQPPKLAELEAVPPGREFWVVKHGIKLTAMPAWGTSHDDAAIWNIVAFLQKLPRMTPDEYRQLTAPGAGHDHDHGQHEHEHEHGNATDASHAHDDGAGDHAHDDADHERDATGDTGRR